MLSTLTYHPSGALFERNPVCGVCWHVCMQMCEDRGGSLNFDLLRSMEQADRLCARIVADTWSLCGIEHYYHWLEDQLSYSRPAVACATATVCLTLALMDDVPEPLLQFSRDMRGLLYGEAGELYDTMRSSAYRQDITLSANIYGTPPSVTPQQALINTLHNTVQQLTNDNQQLKQQIQTMNQYNQYNIGTQNNYNGCTIITNHYAAQPPTATPQAEPTKQASTVEPEDVQPVDTSFFRSDKFSDDIVEKNLRETILQASTKADACRRIMALETYGYIMLSNVKDGRKAELINPFAAPKFVFTGDDFKKARNR